MPEATVLCEGCGKAPAGRRFGGLDLCARCHTLAQGMADDPDAAKTIWLALFDEPILPRPQTASDEDSRLPDVLYGKRYRTVDRENNKWYLSVSEIDGHPVEIFASTAFDRDHELQSRISNLTTITRLISLILRHVFLRERLTLDKCLKQLQRSSRQQNDLPDMLYGVLSRYRDRTP